MSRSTYLVFSVSAKKICPRQEKNLFFGGKTLSESPIARIRRSLSIKKSLPIFRSLARRTEIENSTLFPPPTNKEIPSLTFFWGGAEGGKMLRLQTKHFPVSWKAAREGERSILLSVREKEFQSYTVRLAAVSLYRVFCLAFFFWEAETALFFGGEVCVPNVCSLEGWIGDAQVGIFAPSQSDREIYDHFPPSPITIDSEMYKAAGDFFFFFSGKTMGGCIAFRLISLPSLTPDGAIAHNSALLLGR